MGTRRKPPKGGRFVFCMSFVHKKTGRRVYSRSGKPFCFIVKE
jgi:hypothetical protein